MLDNMARHHQIKRIIIKRKNVPVQIGSFEYKTFWQRALWLAIIHPIMFEFAQAKQLGGFHLPKAEAANIENPSIRRNLFVGLS